MVHPKGHEAPTDEELLAENEVQEMYNPNHKVLDFQKVVHKQIKNYLP